MKVSTLLKLKHAGFALTEALVGMGITGLMFVALYAGMTSGIFTMQMTRENIRATQILVEKLDAIRLYPWAQITTPGFVPATFQAPFYSTSATNAFGFSPQGIIYNGTVSISQSGVAETYAGDMRLVTVSVSWTTSGVQRQRSMSTFVTKNGLHRYIN